jgi:hypothetical protein
MLRTQGVPTRIVLGYRGYETGDAEGEYEVRQYQAHSWVEALIQRPGADRPTWHWLTLDPTPATEDAEEADFQWGNWWEAARSNMALFFKNFIVEYDADQQDRARSVLGQVRWQAVGIPVRDSLLGPSGDDWVRAGVILSAAVGACLSGRWLLRRRARRAEPVDPATALYRRLLDLFARHLGARPQVGQTPREFAAVAAARLESLPGARDLAGLPAHAADVYYRARYGGRPPEAGERRALADRLDRLETALAAAAATG